MSKFECICGKKYKYQQGLSDHGTKSSRHVNDGRGCPMYHQRRAQNKLVNVFGLKDKISTNNTINNNNDEIINNNNEIDNNCNEVKSINKEKYQNLINENKRLNELNQVRGELLTANDEREKNNEVEINNLKKEIKRLTDENAKQNREIKSFERLLTKHGIESKPAFSL